MTFWKEKSINERLFTIGDRDHEPMAFYGEEKQSPKRWRQIGEPINQWEGEFQERSRQSTNEKFGIKQVEM